MAWIFLWWDFFCDNKTGLAKCLSFATIDVLAGFKLVMENSFSQ